jgi:hypothetical protein
MISNITPPLVERVGTFKETSFGISSSEDLVYIFDILRSKLYSNKIAAVIREYSTNAADANTENGKREIPVIITAPTKMSPEFKVRDYGRGLTEDEIRNVYCMYGRSTKRNSNDYTGQLGLGSKSGFAYGDSFTIISYKDGVKHTYTAYIDESRLGSIAKIAESSSSEENGIEIVIPVNIQDVYSFENEIRNCVRHFKVKPKVVNISVQFQSEKEIILSGDGWRLYDGDISHYHHSSNATFVMGNIGYPVNISALMNGSNTEEFPILKCPICVDFNIGDLSISANREELEYNNDTKKSIASRLKDIQKEIIKSANDEMKKCNNIIEAMIQYGKLNRSLSYITNNNLIWRNIKITTAVLQLNQDYCKARLYSPGSKSESVTSIYFAQNNKSISLENVFYHDGVNKNYHRVQHHSATSGKNCVLLDFKDHIDRDGKVHKASEWLKSNHLSIDMFKAASSLADPPIAVRQKKTLGFESTNCFFIKPTSNIKSWGTQSDNFTKGSCNKKGGGIYIRIDSFLCQFNGTRMNCKDLISLAAGFNEVTKDTIDIHKIPCFRSSDADKLGSGWTNIDKYIEEKLKNCTNARLNCEINDANRLYSDLNCYYGIGIFSRLLLDHMESKKDIFHDTDMLELIRLWGVVKNFVDTNKSKARGVTYNAINDITKFFPSFVESTDAEHKESRELRDIMGKIEEKHPVITYIRSFNSTDKSAIENIVSCISKL